MLENFKDNSYKNNRQITAWWRTKELVAGGEDGSGIEGRGRRGLFSRQRLRHNRTWNKKKGKQKSKWKSLDNAKEDKKSSELQ